MSSRSFESLAKSGYARVNADGIRYDLTEDIELDKNKKHNIEVIVDRLVVREGIERRLADSLETVLNLASGLALIDIVGQEQIMFSQNFACIDCGISLPRCRPECSPSTIPLAHVLNVLVLDTC